MPHTVSWLMAAVVLDYAEIASADLNTWNFAEQ
jgi:hypothetical protein